MRMALGRSEQLDDNEVGRVTAKLVGMRMAYGGDPSDKSSLQNGLVG